MGGAGEIRRGCRAPWAGDGRPRQGRHGDEPARYRSGRARIDAGPPGRSSFLTAGGDLHPFCVGRPGRPQHHGDGACPVRQGAPSRQRSSDFAVSSTTPPTARRRSGFPRRGSMRSGPGWRSTARCPRRSWRCRASRGRWRCARASWRCARSRSGPGSATGESGTRRVPLGWRRCRSGTRTATPPRPGCRGPAGGRRIPIVGAVCMDMLMVDVTDLPPRRSRGR